MDAMPAVTIQPPTTHPHQPSARSLSYEDALDLGYCSSPEAMEEGSQGQQRRQDDALKERCNKEGEAAATKGKSNGPANLVGGLRSVIIKSPEHRLSYKEALLRSKTFKPQASHAWSASGDYIWCKVGSTRASKSSARPSCRDPPNCILCSWSDHKARHCLSSGEGRKEPAAKAALRKPPLLLDPTPGAPERHVERITACTTWSGALWEAEWEVEIHGLVAVQLDARVHLTCEAMRRDVLRQLRIPEHELMVTHLKPAWFLLRFESSHLHNTALATRVLPTSCTGLRLMPWTKQVSAKSSSLFYRVRVCIEGLPGHGHQIETVTPLFKTLTIIDTVDPERQRDEEIGCFCLWLWTSDLDVIAKEGVLQIAKPVEVSDDYFISLGNMELPNLRSGPAKMLDYEVIIHIDRIEDYTSRSGSSSNQSYQSDIGRRTGGRSHGGDAAGAVEEDLTASARITREHAGPESTVEALGLELTDQGGQPVEGTVVAELLSLGARAFAIDHASAKNVDEEAEVQQAGVQGGEEVLEHVPEDIVLLAGVWNQGQLLSLDDTVACGDPKVIGTGQCTKMGHEKVQAQLAQGKENDPSGLTLMETACPKYMKATSAPLLTTPAKKVTCKVASKKADASTDGTMPKSRKSTRLANRPIGDMTMEEQATTLLMKKCNFLEKKQKPDDQAKIMFCSSFADPMP
ncbi:hypothetical protein C2845_PM06G20220 [Panicum miliaceum]|uniref:DUF4283 domain-containing protein n=1 Tax=Panicum miliaceum TaxID=4540 RepID=A0A3L6R6W9_PANMI|nr:hypothetical protein C2845_PM06G20220 [Panicum miliaceum]